MTTGDKNKLKVYLENYDGHCLRAYTYYPEKLKDIQDTVESINSIKKKYKDIRQDSKPITFALTYLGTYLTLMKNCGLSESEAKRIYTAYHRLYAESDAWVKAKLDEAARKGYVELAFGLRLRTPLLRRSLLDTRVTTKQAAAESRTAANALGQSWGLLNSRAGQEFMAKARTSQYRYDVRPMAQIHDSQYFLVRDDIDIIQWLNIHLVKAISWQEDEAIQHDTVKLTGQTSLLIPTWADEVDIPNGASKQDIIKACLNEVDKRNHDKANPST